MANYLARVELHSATYDDYEVLHAAMQRKGFSRTIASDGRVLYSLPTGTYVIGDTGLTPKAALDATIRAANATGKKHSTIITDWANAMWDGLPKA